MGVELLFSLAVMLISMVVKIASASHTNTPETTDRGVLANTTDTQVPLRLVYGHHRVGVNWVDERLAGVDNTYLHCVATLCEGEINGIVQVAGVDQIFLNGNIYTDFKNDVYYEKFTGSPTQPVCATYHALNINWDSALRYTAYLYMRFKYDSSVFQARPEITAELEGLKIYNPATNVTEYSDNPALCVYDFLTRPSTRGGLGINSSRIDIDSVISAAAYCTAKGWTCNIVLQDAVACIDMLTSLLTTFRGSVIYSGSLFRIVYQDLDYETSVMDLTENDIIEASGKSSLVVTQPSIFDTPNAVKMQYYNSEKAFAADELVFSDPDAIISDGGDYRETDINVAGITSTANVQKMANYFLERLRVNKTAAMTIGTKGMALEPQDLITVTHSRPGWVKKMMRVSQPSISQNGEVGLTLLEEYESFYDDVYNLADHSYHDTNLPDPKAAIPNVINVTSSEENYNYRGRSFTRWKINFDKPLSSIYPWWDHADIYIKIGAAGDWKYMTTALTDFTLDPVEEGQQYFCCLVSVSIWGSKQDFADGYVISQIITGLTSVPDNITGFTALAHGDNISLFADELSDPDIAGYELRLGAAWEGGLFIAFNETPNFRLVGVRPSPPGSPHVFWIAARDNAGNYSTTPAPTSVTVFYPANYTNKNVWAWDFNGIGAFVNTEHEIYDGSNALKCSHAANVLTGKWTSPEYDLGSEKTVRIWGDFITEFESAGGSWGDLFPAPALWSSKISPTTKWYEVLSPAYAGVLMATLKWGTSSGVYPDSTTKLEILAPEIYARYLQIEITLIDPNIASNLHLKTLNMIGAYWQ
jgi:hypothetical protein